MSERDRYVKTGERTSRLSLAVHLVDAFTGRQPAYDPPVRIEGVDATPVKNLSGYHVFLDLEPSTVTVVVEGGERYLDTRREGIHLPDHSDPNATIDPSDPETVPLRELSLVPSPAYQFPPGATLIRGHVRNPSGGGVDGAELTVRALDRSAASAGDDAQLVEQSTVTNESGEFVLFFGATESPAVTDGTKLLQGPDGDPTIEVTHPEFENTTVTVAVEEGTVTVHDIEYP